MSISQIEDTAPGSVGDELPPGTELGNGQFTIERYLNSGGFGVTYLARDSLGRRVVIKECYPGAMCCRKGAKVRLRTTSSLGDFDRVKGFFKKEADALAQLSHPNVVGVHQIFEENGTAYMALDYIDGPDLLDLYEAKPEHFTPDELNRILVSLLDALTYVHGSGTLHRDISPDNILMGPDNEPVLIDFGAARAGAARTSRILSQVYTVKDGYSPQEFYLVNSPQGRSSDLYALAATMYHLVTGDPPPHSNERLAAVAENRPDPYVALRGQHPGFDGRFLEAIDICLSVFPKDRMDNADQWRTFLTTERRTGQADTRVGGERDIERRVSSLVQETQKAIAEDNEKAIAAETARPGAQVEPEPVRRALPTEKGPEYWAILNEDPEKLARDAARWKARQDQARNREERQKTRERTGFSLAGLLGLRRGAVR